MSQIPGSRRRVILLKDDSLEKDQVLNTHIKYVKLRHPGSEKMTFFSIVEKTTKDGIQKANRQIYEIMSYNQQHRSWLIGNSFSSNNIIHISTPIDPLFFALYYLYKYCQTQAKLLDQLPEEECQLIITEVLLEINSEDLKRIADEKIIGDLKVYKYNEEKTMKWLKLKTDYLSGLLENKILFNLKNESSVDSELYKNRSMDIKYMVLDILQGYVNEDIIEKFDAKYGFTNRKRTITSEDPRKSKKCKVNDDTANVNACIQENHIKIQDDYVNSNISNNRENHGNIQTTKKEPKKNNKKMKSLEKAATGTKNLKLFFKSN